jgi:mannose-6-phosphate isomerase
MQQFLKMKNTIQPYAWGSHSAIGELLGLPVPTDKPQAEIWMGAHPKAPSQVLWQGSWHFLTNLLKTDAEDILGTLGYQRYGNQLPFLFKVLAAERPLSIQVHPDRTQAKIGYAMENLANIPLSAAYRNYKDDNHKPECLCALTPFVALCGFRPIPEMIKYMQKILPPEFEYLLTPLQKEGDSRGLKTFFNHLMTLSKSNQKELIAKVISKAKLDQRPSSVIKWLLTLHQYYPEDIGVLSPFYLNLLELAPGQAIFLKAGVLHAYLLGTGIELMANSDNVLRGGLTTKHIDGAELMQVLTFESASIENQIPMDNGSTQKKFVSPFEEFELSIITVENDKSYLSEKERGVEILLCTEGDLNLTNLSDHTQMDLVKGESVLIPADLDQYDLRGTGVAYKAKGPV